MNAATPSDGSVPTNGPVPLLDIGPQNDPLHDEIDLALRNVCRSGRFVQGPECRELEQAIARYCGTDHAVGCASGSDALLLALMAKGVHPGDEVILPSFTFFATASAVWRLGATPVFVDIDAKSFNLDPDRIEAAISPTTKAIMPVHLFGRCADMAAICQIAEEHRLAVIEDAAQSIGAEHFGRRAGALGDLGCFSFYPSKNLGGFGDGGMITTSDASIAQALRVLRDHGQNPRYYHQVVGVNSRLDTLQAAVLKIKLDHLEHWTRERQENARRYAELFHDAGLESFITLPTSPSEHRAVWNQYTIRVRQGRRDGLAAYLGQHQVGTAIYYPLPLHRQPCFERLGYGEGSLPRTEQACADVLSLPIYPGLTESGQRTVVNHIAAFCRSSSTASQDRGAAAAA